MDTLKEYVTHKMLPRLSNSMDEELGKILMSDEQRDNFKKNAIKSVMELIPQENIEEKPINEDNVITKLFLKGNPNILHKTIEGILNSLVVKKQNGCIDLEKTGEYVLTLMIEKIP